MIDPQQLAERYVDVWNEADDDRRSKAIAELWPEDGWHYVGQRALQGYPALEERILHSHNEFVRDKGYRFKAVSDARSLHDVVTFHWEMLPSQGNEVLATGLEILVVDRQGRIRSDYQFPL